MRETAHNTFSSQLIQPFKVCAVGLWLDVKEASNCREGLPTIKERPTVDVVFIYRLVNLKERS